MSENKWLPPLVFKDGKQFEFNRIFLPEMLFIDCNWSRDVGCKINDLNICRPCYQQDGKGEELYEDDIIERDGVFRQLLIKHGSLYYFVFNDDKAYEKPYDLSDIRNFTERFTRHGNINDAAFIAVFKAEHPELFNEQENG